MITRIEIDGFKTFQDFAVDLAPFQVIIGPNGSGKSNFFDALGLLSKLADSDLRTAFKSIRGNINELFTVLPNGKNIDRMRFAVEMLVEDTQELNHLKEDAPKYLQMRYEIEVRQRSTADGFEQLYVHDEKLAAVSVSAIQWGQRCDFLAEEATVLDTSTWFVGTVDFENAITNADGSRSGSIIPDILEKKQGVFYSFEMNKGMGKIKATNKVYEEALLSSYSSVRYPHLLIVQHELNKIRLLRLDIQTLKQPSRYVDERSISTAGENLPATLARMQTQDKHLLRSVSRDVSNIVSNFAQIEVDRDEGRKQITLYAHTRDKRRFSIDALSEGTLRILALATLRNDPQLSGTLCFEDPEMGVHPGALEKIVRLLRGMATDLNDPEDLKLPLRQVLVTTHSPQLVSHLNIEQGELLFVTTPTRVVPGGDAWQVTRFTSVCADNKQGPDQTYALSNVIAYLNNPDAAAKRERLRETMRR